MKIADLKKIIERVEDSGFSDADVFLTNGIGKDTPIAGWEFVTSAGLENGENTGGCRLRLKTHRSKP